MAHAPRTPLVQYMFDAESDFMVLTKTAVHLLRALNTAVRIISGVDWCCNVTFMSPGCSGVTSTICACVEQALTIVYIVTY